VWGGGASLKIDVPESPVGRNRNYVSFLVILMKYSIKLFRLMGSVGTSMGYLEVPQSTF